MPKKKSYRWELRGSDYELASCLDLDEEKKGMEHHFRVDYKHCYEWDDGVFVPLLRSHSVHYGDGGDADLNYRLDYCPRVFGYESQLGDELAIQMREIAERRCDLQANGVVEDIVDPDMWPRLIPPHQRTRCPPLKVGDLPRAALINSNVRGSYTWIPSLVQWREGKATFQSPIHNLPRCPTNEKVYQNLEAVLTQMMPSLANYGKSVDSDGTLFKIAVKLQRYVVPAGATYTGQWHTEGVTENVSAVGVYYAEWPDALSGGELKFRPSEIPHSWYREDLSDEDAVLDLTVEAQQDTGIVFGNELPHRFRSLTNTSDQPQYRSFVNFFVCDPSLPTTAEVPTNADIYLSIVQLLNFDVVSDVLSFLQFQPLTWRAAVQLRSQAKAEMVAHRGSWGYIHHGNCGTLHWAPTGGPKAEGPDARHPDDNHDGWQWTEASHQPPSTAGVFELAALDLN